MATYRPFIAASRAELLARFDAAVAALRKAIGDAGDETFLRTGSMVKGSQVLMSMPKIAVLRTWTFNHTVHHRGQFSVYLRLCDVPVPSIYGASADEKG